MIKRVDDAQAEQVETVFNALDELLKSVDADGHKELSTVLPSGFEKRLQCYARALLKAIDEPEALVSLSSLMDDVTKHRQASLENHRVERAEMATRLVRYIHMSNTDDYNTMENSVRSYSSSGGYVDWARTVLYHGESNQHVAKIYSRILATVTELRQKQNKLFGTAFSGWTSTPKACDKLIGVEEVLGKVVKPAAQTNPLLFIVLDGMSHAVFFELMESFGGAWSMYDDSQGNFSHTVAATVPSVTVISRRSLLIGELTNDSSANEAQGFSRALKTGEQNKPILFHKKDLTTADGVSLSQELADALNSSRQIVGVVVNAIDDDLDKGDQVVKIWNLKTLSVLDMLLAAAAECDRRIVMTSDHGHVLDRGSRLFEGGDDAGERNRLADGQALEGELLFEGSRVLKGSNRLIVPWDETVRYRRKKNGYHGGVTPQEILVPIALLARQPEEEWVDRILEKPDWWYASENVPVRDAVTKKVSTIAPEHKDVATLPLFEIAPKSVITEEVASIPWVEELLKSPLYASQKSMTGRTTPNDERVALFLEVVQSRGGRCLRPALAQSMKMPALRLQGLIAAMQ